VSTSDASGVDIVLVELRFAAQSNDIALATLALSQSSNCRATIHVNLITLIHTHIHTHMHALMY